MRIASLLSLLAAVFGAVLPALGAASPAQGENRNRPLWLSRENGPGNNLDSAQAVAVSADGRRVFVTGYIDGVGPDEEYATIAYDAATGRKLWRNRYNGSPCLDTAVALASSPDNSKVFVTGYSGCLAQEDYATVAYDGATGQELWVSRYDGPTGDPDEPYAITVGPDGSRVFVTGRSFGFIGDGRDYATVAYDAANGQELWVRRYVGPGVDEENSDDEAYAVAVSPDGNKVFVTGGSVGTDSSWDYATVAYDAISGHPLWITRYNGPGNAEDLAQAMAISPDGTKVFVTGYSFGLNSLADYATAAYDAATGTELWLHRYNGASNGFDYSYALAASPDGTRVFVTGSSDGTDLGISDYATVAYHAVTGKELWSSRYNGPGNYTDSAQAIGVSPDGSRVFVTGYSSGNDVDFPFDYATLAYNAVTGQRLWLNRYNSPAKHSDLAYDLVVSPDGAKVFVTGASDGIESGTDYATLGYATTVVER